ncbi:MAG TPA: hypothetical protein VGG74_18590 [Kofleriaceae bacterium]|jgi:hypothetical protein
MWRSHPLADFHDAERFGAPMRADDNGIEAEVARVTSRCEADALASQYEARGHKQLYWVAPLAP